MIFESISTLTLPKVGFGTTKIGGWIIPNWQRDDFYMSALRSALTLGYVHFDTAELYALGHSEELIGRAIRETNTNREKVFITTKAWPAHLSYPSILRACENSLRRLDTEYIDLYLVHIPNPLIPLEETFRGLNELIRTKKIRHVGVSNFNIRLLQKAQVLSESPIVTNQIPYNLYSRSYKRNGVIDYCQENDVIITAYSPLNRGAIGSNAILQSIAKAHRASIPQIALAWLIAQPRVIAIPMSLNPAHQLDNLNAAEILLSSFEIEQLTALN